MPHPHLKDKAAAQASDSNAIPKWQQHQFTGGATTARAGDIVVLKPQGLYCPAGDFYVDPWLPVQRAVITHGHGDHARIGMGEYHVVQDSMPILHWRLGEQRYVVRAYGETFELGRARISFHPAGHVLGSCQVRIEVDGEVWVVSGDYKRQPDPTCAAFEVVPCDTFITEATFGLPVYRWPDTPGVAKEIIAWRDECAERGETAVLFCYALGKAQRLLAEIGRLTTKPALLHGGIDAGVQVYRRAGIEMLETRTVPEDMVRRRGQRFPVGSEKTNGVTSSGGDPCIRCL